MRRKRLQVARQSADQWAEKKGNKVKQKTERKRISPERKKEACAQEQKQVRLKY